MRKVKLEERDEIIANRSLGEYGSVQFLVCLSSCEVNVWIVPSRSEICAFRDAILASRCETCENQKKPMTDPVITTPATKPPTNRPALPVLAALTSPSDMRRLPFPDSVIAATANSITKVCQAAQRDLSRLLLALLEESTALGRIAALFAATPRLARSGEQIRRFLSIDPVTAKWIVFEHSAESAMTASLPPAPASPG